MNLYDEILKDIEDVFEYQAKSNNQFVKPTEISGLFGFYAEFDDVWGQNGEYYPIYKLAYAKITLFLFLVIKYGFNYDSRCYEMVSHLGKYEVKTLKEYEEKIKTYVAEHPEK